MKVILEHLKLQTVPHDMVDELHLAGVKFYDGMLTLSPPLPCKENTQQ